MGERQTEDVLNGNGDVSVLSWMLGAQTPAPAPDVAQGIELIRPIEGEELNDVRAANRLLRTLANANDYARVVESYLNVEQAVEALGSALAAPSSSVAMRGQRTDDVRRTLVAYRSAATSFFNQLASEGSIL
jgi:hypothetical protein